MNDPYVNIILVNKFILQYLIFFRAFTPDYEENWRWRFQWNQLKQSSKDKLKSLTFIYGRYLPKEALEVPDTENSAKEKTDATKQATLK